MNNYFNYDDDDWTNETLSPLSADEVRSGWPDHEHCVFCFDLDCQDQNCKMRKCDGCWARFHECKTADHQEICPRAMCPCLNASYGCPEIMRRDHLGSHLATCGASLVVCNLQWNREAVGKQAKRRMKQVARGFRSQMLPGELKQIEEGELDVFAALMDQKEIMKSYRTGRKTRVRQRTACTPANPVLPLRFYDEIDKFNEDDSSDEEIFQDEQKRIKTKQPFADCYICKLEPGMQHLHVLGNLSGSALGKKEGNQEIKKNSDEILELVVPKFYQKRNLFMKISEARMPDFHRKAFQYRWTREMHTFTCTETMRRDEIKAHMDYHNVVLQQVDGNIVKRCPAAPEGCDFFINQLVPRIGGRIRFDHQMQQFLFEPSYSEVEEEDSKRGRVSGGEKNSEEKKVSGGKSASEKVIISGAEENPEGKVSEVKENSEKKVSGGKSASEKVVISGTEENPEKKVSGAERNSEGKVSGDKSASEKVVISGAEEKVSEVKENPEDEEISENKNTSERGPISGDKKEPSVFGDFREPHVLRLLLPYLDTTTIRTMSSLNLTLNKFIKTLIKSRSMISLIWKKTGKGKWEVAGKFRSFSNLPDVMDLVPNVKANSTMIGHISACQFYQKMDHGRDKALIEKFVELGVRPASDIWKKQGGHGLRHVGLDINDYQDFVFDD